MDLLIIILLLLINNGVLVYSECNRRKDLKTRLNQLHQNKLDDGFTEELINDEDLADEIEPKQIFSWVFAICICLDIWIVSAVATHCWARNFFNDVSSTDNREALFGDSFGAVNALVSAFAFAGMIVAFILQRYELKLQRKELRDNREEMVRQTKQFKVQNDNLEIQRFENLFYNMLTLQQSIVSGLRYEYYEEEIRTVSLEGGGVSYDKHYEKREVVGRDVFRYLFESVELEVEESRTGKVHGYRGFLHYRGLSNYDTTLIPSYFDHYFRHLYKIVQFVDSQNFEFDLKYRYLSFLRGTLSRYELVWLYYNTLSPAFYKFKILIERYSLLKALRYDLLTISKETNTYYTSLGITLRELESLQFNGRDFEFYLTDNDEEKNKYKISAFWNRNDLDRGLEHLKRWLSFINSKAGAIIVSDSK